ncbi:thioredoxin domain-containing protein 16 isoform X6 [Loxodonta africana]|uniref:thioredoxin domain-containing protein 16 isoform X6 n=1 Tax=Loxodonta africana TaxID=9785 RepID=UPI0030CF2CE6
MMSSSFNIFRVGFSFVMMHIFNNSTVVTLPELSPQKYFSTLQPGKASLAYFCQADSPSTSVFLEELNEAVKPLQDYGISVAKVNCVKEEISRYCGKEKDLMKAYLFRGNILLREFPTDTLFDVNAIVAHVLFALLFNEVKYVTTLEDLQNIENVLKGKANIAFAYVRAIGTPEHRAVMEAAFVYGTTYQFVLTTEMALLESIGSEDIQHAHLYFFHCKPVLDFIQQCGRTLMEQPLTTLNIHRFIKTMEAPLLTEVAEDPQQVSTTHLQLGLPLVFIVSQQVTYEADRRTAEWVAWRLLGKAGVLLLLRDSLEVNIPQHANVVFKRAEEGVPVEYLVLDNIDLIVSHVENNVHTEEIQEDEDYDIEDPDMGEAVSMAFLQSYIDVAIKLKAIEDFIEAGNYLKGYVITGVYPEEDVLILSNKYATTVPALLLARHKEGRIESIPLASTHVQEIVQIITNALLETFPEITVENLPNYLRLQKPLLILFSDGSINHKYEEVILTLIKQKHLDSLTPCWLNLKNTPVGRGILRAYFDPLPPLPLLVLVNLHSGGQVFAFPSDQSITEQHLLLWLKKLEAGLESHIRILPAEEWKPPLPAYDFLSMMDDATSPHPTRKAPECMKETDVQENDKEQHEDKSTARKEPVETLRIKHWSRSNWFKEAEKSFRHDKEL